MSPSTAKLLRAAVAVEIDQHEAMHNNTTAFKLVGHEIAYLVRHVRKLVQAPQGLGKKGIEPTDMEIEAEVKAQLAQRCAEAFGGTT